jgi:hypothetical protein
MSHPSVENGLASRDQHHSAALGQHDDEAAIGGPIDIAAEILKMDLIRRDSRSLSALAKCIQHADRATAVKMTLDRRASIRAGDRVRTHSQNRTVAARATAEMKVFEHLS